MRFASPEIAAAYLAGVVDGEGHITHRHSQRGVTIINTDFEILRAATDALDMLGIEWSWANRDEPNLADQERWGIKSRKPIAEVSVSRRPDLERFAEMVPLQSCKAAVLREAVASYRARPPYERVAEMKRAGASTREVAEVLGVPHSTAYLWLSKCEDPPPLAGGRPRGKGWSDAEREKRMATFKG